ncbi:PREDICTED: tyrosine-protein phosphatase non-receptor type 61F-like isoform X2 [Nicrophorus vespilloides]|uniref:protein-tyrosine-phosphatase n=1 Tax=Nicrophorus vespilloides TaxID=110193 RepID=A0ABM1MMZ5_NICVS|nr:PREDICTED: tyrosine-protein phosphatase non-receptor type 61F-like isoform X2 [Nicrophorus vespilloides]
MTNNGSTSNNIETEYLELNRNLGWPLLYQKIRAKSVSNNYTQLESVKPQNKPLNRYRDVSPYDHSRIVLKKGSTDYINANLICVKKAKRRYILTQGPLCNTVNHFWLMVWEQGSKAVLMLNKLIEKKQEKCHQYWPSKTGSEHAMVMENVGLTLEYVEYHDYSYYLTRTLKLTDTESGESRQIIQFHYTTWPDFGVPSSPTAFLEFLKKVRDAGALEEDVGPAIVHCSAGIGRSGTFCLVDSCLVLIESYGQNAVDIKEILLELRHYRMGLIQTIEQLRFSYQAIIEGAKKLSEPCEDKENCNSDLIVSNNIEEVVEAHSSDEEEPPPLPPPRMDSLNRNCGPPIDRPLPNIPNSTSLSDFSYPESDSEKESCPSGPLPTVPGEDEEDEDDDTSSVDEVEDETELDKKQEDDEDVEEEEDAVCDTIINNRCASPSAELRQRNRIERKTKLSDQVRDMKRRQQANEQWTQLKRPKTTLPD